MQFVPNTNSFSSTPSDWKWKGSNCEPKLDICMKNQRTISCVLQQVMNQRDEERILLISAQRSKPHLPVKSGLMRHWNVLFFLLLIKLLFFYATANFIQCEVTNEMRIKTYTQIWVYSSNFLVLNRSETRSTDRSDHLMLRPQFLDDPRRQSS